MGQQRVELADLRAAADLPVAEEAAVTAELLGITEVVRLWDVGVAGIQRLLRNRETVNDCDVVIVAAGMEGALPSVVAGLVDAPVVAVPTSVGYGASLQGVTPLLTMLSTCAPGIGVVNIDNGARKTPWSLCWCWCRSSSCCCCSCSCSRACCLCC